MSLPPPPPPPPPPPSPPPPPPPPRPAAAPAEVSAAEPMPITEPPATRAVTLVLASIGAVAILGIGVIGGLAVFGSDDGSAAIAVPTTSLALREPVVEPTTVTTPAPTTTAAPDTTVPETTGPEPTVAPTTVPPATVPPTTIAPVITVSASTPTDPDVAESKAVVRGGQIFLEGAVPTQEAGDAIVALAAEVLGPQNVINNYVVDPGAGDPNLGNITVDDTINFASDSAVIQSSAEGLLNQGLVLLQIRPAMTIMIVGHTDALGTPEKNLVLSQARADAVKTWFTERGVDPARLTTEGRGQTEPIADNGTPDGRRENRRIQFFLENILGDG